MPRHLLQALRIRNVCQRICPFFGGWCTTTTISRQLEKQLGRIRNVRSETIWCCKWSNSIEVACFFWELTAANWDFGKWDFHLAMGCAFPWPVLAANNNWIRSNITHSWPSICLLGPFVMASIISRACLQYLSHIPYPISRYLGISPSKHLPATAINTFCWAQLSVATGSPKLTR